MATEIDFALLTFDVTSRDSYEQIRSFRREVADASEKQVAAGRNEILCVLVACKCDLVDARAVTFEEAAALAGALDCVAYVETSAKTGINCGLPFQEALYADELRTFHRPPKVGAKSHINKKGGLLGWKNKWRWRSTSATLTPAAPAPSSSSSAPLKPDRSPPKAVHRLQPEPVPKRLLEPHPPPLSVRASR